MRVTVASVLGSLLLSFTVAAPSGEGAAAADCSARTIRGAYGLQVQGFLGEGSRPTPVAVVRTAVFDGRGRFTGEGFQAVGGVVVPISASGTYRVNADCTFSTEGTVTSGGPNRQFGVVVGGGSKILAVRIDQGHTDTLTYERVR